MNFSNTDINTDEMISFRMVTLFKFFARSNPWWNKSRSNAVISYADGHRFKIGSMFKTVKIIQMKWEPMNDVYVYMPTDECIQMPNKCICTAFTLALSIIETKNKSRCSYKTFIFTYKIWGKIQRHTWISYSGKTNQNYHKKKSKTWTVK